jgi:hypothetical protein
MDKNIKQFIFRYSKKVGLILNSHLTENDIYNTAYILSDENNKQVKDNLVRIIWNEKYNQINNFQKHGLVSVKHEKQCNHCKQVKNQMEFDHRFSKLHNITYLNFICKDCRIEYNRNYYNKKKQQKHG